MIEAIPVSAACAVSFLVAFPLVPEHVMLAWNVKYIFCFGILQDLARGVKLVRLGEMRNVAGMNQEFGLFRRGVNLRDGFAQRARYVWIRIFVKSDMGVANFNKTQAFDVFLLLLDPKKPRNRHPGRNRPKKAGARPAHAV